MDRGLLGGESPFENVCEQLGIPNKALETLLTGGTVSRVMWSVSRERERRGWVEIRENTHLLTCNGNTTVKKSIRVSHTQGPQ